MTPMTPLASPSTLTFTAFDDQRRIATGPLAEVAVAVKECSDLAGGGAGTLLVFDDQSGRVVDLDLRGTAEDVLLRLPRVSEIPDASHDPARPQKPQKPRRPGRPKLGVVGREVTLLPRHWEWLNRQPGGASVTLRKLVETARRAGGGRERARQAREAAYRFMSAMAGDCVGFEEASRALFAGDRAKLMQESHSWPEDVRAYTFQLAEHGLHTEETDGHA